MESNEHQARWPAIGQSDVAVACHKICESILELERAFEAEELSSRLTSGFFEQVIGPQLRETYGKLLDSAPGPLHQLRVAAVHALLAQLRNDLSPVQVAHAHVYMPVKADSGTNEPETDASPKLGFNIADASLNGISNTTLRLDQMLDARFWRIGFTFDTPNLNDAFAQLVVRTATGSKGTLDGRLEKRAH
jgi:hypothetical protein